MADVKWIKITTDIFDDEKILLIESLPDADATIVIWFKLLCLAGKQNNSGVFQMSNGMPYTDDMLAIIFRRKPSQVKLALETFKQFGMIEIIENTITIPNWEKHQSLDQLERIREYQKEYHREYRKKQANLIESKVDSKVYDKVDVNILDKNRLDKNRLEEDKNINKENIVKETTTKTTRFIPPTLKEVQEYCLSRSNNIDAEAFIDYYTSKGWMIGKNKMKDWKAAVRTWERNDYAPVKQQVEQEPVVETQVEEDVPQELLDDIKALMEANDV